jgi:hypothetical protein
MSPAASILENNLYDEGTSYPALGFNPAPGSPAAVAGLGGTFRDVAAHLGEAHGAIRRAARAGGIWEGAAAEAFTEDLGRLPGYLAEATESFETAGKTLDTWERDLASLQNHAADYERQARAAQQQVNQAKGNPQLQLAGRIVPADELPRVEQARRELHAARDELEGIRKAAKRLQAEHKQLAAEAAQAFKAAQRRAPHAPGALERLEQGFEKLWEGAKDVAGKVWKWTQDHADVIAKIGDVLSDVGAALSVVTAATAEIPVVGEVAEAASLTVNGAALTTHGIAKAAGADVSYTTLAMDGLGMIPGGGVLRGAVLPVKLGKVAKAASAGTKALRTAQRGEKLGSAAGGVGKFLTRESKAAVASRGAVARESLQSAAGQVWNWETDPLGNAEGSAKDFYDKLSHGQRPPSAGQVFRKVALGAG